MLLDPWLKGTEYLFTWFRTATHLEPSAYETDEAITELIAKIEKNATGHDNVADDSDTDHVVSGIDLVVVSHHATDHMHKDTLTSLSPDIPVCASDEAGPTIKSWNHFKTIVPLPVIEDKEQPGTKSARLAEPLPQWLGLFRRPSFVQFICLITFPSSTTSFQELESILYTPHSVPKQVYDGFLAKAEQRLSAPFKTLCMIHNMNFSKVTGIYTGLDAHNGLKLQRVTNAKYWVRTHDEKHIVGGILGYLETRKDVTLEEALEKEIEESSDACELERPRLIDLGNGESYVLE